MFLRPAWPEDAEEVFGAVEDYQDRPDVTVEPLPRTSRELQRFIAQSRDPRLPHFFMYLRGAEGPALVGGIGFGRFGDDVELGYWVRPRYRGRGYATEAIRAVLKQARSLGHRRVFAKHFADAPGAGCVLERLGFEEVGDDYSRRSADRNGYGPARVFLVNLERRAGPRPEAMVDAMPA
jgi:RimJ/RimL family protein N-acetyltransferase